MSTYSSVYGIDVSMADLDVVNLNEEKMTIKKVKNNDNPIKKWIKNLPCKNVLCVLEPTGCYSDRILYYLNKNNIAVAVVSPNQSHGFFQAQGIVSKNDKQAAHSLALMGQRLDLPLHKAKSDDMLKRKQLLMGINALKKQRQAIRNQLHALNHQIIFVPKVVEAFKETLAIVEKQLTELEEELNDISDEEHSKQFQLITSNATNGIHNFQHAGQVAKLAGVVPSSHQSGSSVRKQGRITKKGNNELRACLYMAARSAKRYNLACKALYERLRFKGKPHKKAMVAVMNKLVKQVFGVVHSGVSFDNQFYLKTIKL